MLLFRYEVTKVRKQSVIDTSLKRSLGTVGMKYGSLKDIPS